MRLRERHRRVAGSLVVWLVLAVLVWALVDGQFPGGYLDRRAESEQFLLLLVILGVGVFIRHGNDFVDRLKKIGPVEFFAREAGPLLHALKELDLKYIGEGKPLTKDEVFKYEQADLLVSNFQFSNVEKSSLASDRDLHELIFRISIIAYQQRDWARSIDRLELLIKISNGGYEPRETYFRCSKAYLYLAESYERQPPKKLRQRQALFRRALELTEEVLATKYKNDHRLYSNKAYAQDELGMHKAAIESNDFALKLYPKFAPAKYNKAIAQIKMGWLEKAFASLEELNANDNEIEETMKIARNDPELDPLCHHTEWRKRMADFFEARLEW